MRIGRVEFDAALGRASRTNRILFLAALLGRAIEGEVIVVGGSAIDVYAEGSEPSLDVDLVTLGTPRSEARAALESWGFSQVGKNWRREDWQLEVDLRGSSFRGSRSRARRFDTPYGQALVAGPEDLLVKRLAELKHWPTSPKWREALLRQVSILLSTKDLALDEDYLDFLARRDDVTDLLDQFRKAGA